MRDAATQLGAPARTVRRWLQTGKLEGTLTTDGWIVRPAAIRRLKLRPAEEVTSSRPQSRSTVDLTSFIDHLARVQGPIRVEPQPRTAELLEQSLEELRALHADILAELRGLRADLAPPKALEPARGGRWWNGLLGSKA